MIIKLWYRLWKTIKHDHIFERIEISDGDLFRCVYCGFQMLKKH